MNAAYNYTMIAGRASDSLEPTAKAIVNSIFVNTSLANMWTPPYIEEESE